MTREDEIFDLRMTERDLHLAITNLKIFLQFARNVGKGVKPYGMASLYLRLHQLQELQMLRKMVKGQEITVD